MKQPKRIEWTFEQKRMMARDYVRGMARKQIAAKWGISQTTLKDIIRDYVIIKREERYPSDEQVEFSFTEYRRSRPRVHRPDARKS